MHYRGIAMACFVFTLSACADQGGSDGVSARHCSGLGFKPGTKEYERCLRDERTSRLMEEQRQDFERMKQEQQDWKLRRY